MEQFRTVLNEHINKTLVFKLCSIVMCKDEYTNDKNLKTITFQCRFLKVRTISSHHHWSGFHNSVHYPSIMIELILDNAHQNSIQKKTSSGNFIYQQDTYVILLNTIQRSLGLPGASTIHVTWFFTNYTMYFK